MDEPFAALDALTREEMQRFLWMCGEKPKRPSFASLITSRGGVSGRPCHRLFARPGTVKAQVKITLPRPRDTLSVEFLEYQKKIAGHIVERNSRQKATGKRQQKSIRTCDFGS
jgi:NitT/TauT family transport system ATP-binding protein